MSDWAIDVITSITDLHQEHLKNLREVENYDGSDAIDAAVFRPIIVKIIECSGYLLATFFGLIQIAEEEIAPKFFELMVFVNDFNQKLISATQNRLPIIYEDAGEAVLEIEQIIRIDDDV